jgi:iron-sulfur cluster assembly protein
VLHVTPAAAEAIEEITSSVPGSAGMRITMIPEASTNGTGPTTVFDFYPAPEPDLGDAVIEAEGIQLFLEPEVAPFLDDKLLDAEISGDEVRFMVAEQA